MGHESCVVDHGVGAGQPGDVHSRQHHGGGVSVKLANNACENASRMCHMEQKGGFENPDETVYSVTSIDVSSC